MQRAQRKVRGHRGSDGPEQHALAVEPAIEQRNQSRIIGRAGVEHEALERELALLPRSWPRAQERAQIIEVALHNGRADLVEAVEVPREPERDALLV